LLGNVLWEYLHHKGCKGKNQKGEYCLHVVQVAVPLQGP
jgi:hypothetical protein